MCTKYKTAIKERIRLSNVQVSLGFEPDPWVVQYRLKNNAGKAKWKATQPLKAKHVHKVNSGSFKKGRVALSMGYG